MVDWAKYLVFVLVGWPAFSALAVSLCRQKTAALWLGRLAALGTLAVWAILWALRPSDAQSIGAAIAWMSPLGSSLHLRLDGAGLSVAGLIAVVGAAAVLAGGSGFRGGARAQTALILLAEAGMLGVVASWDLLLFVVFWELTLVPFFFLMEPPAEERGPSAATRLLVCSLSASVFMWVGVLHLVNAAGELRTFDLVELKARLGDQAAGYLGWFIPAFLGRMAAVPLHTWLPSALARVPAAAGMLLVGGMLPLSVYGLWHVVGTLAGPELGPLGDWLLWLGVATALAGGLSALVQGDLKKLLAQVCLAHSGLALAALGLGSGALPWLAEVAAGMAGASLALFLGVICEARGSQRVLDMGGLWRSHPFFAGIAFASVASLALVPGTAGFSGAFGLLQNAGGQPAAVCLVAGGVVLAGVALLWAFRFILGGSHIPSLWLAGRWPRPLHVVVLFVLALLLLVGGVAPGVLPHSNQASSASAASLRSSCPLSSNTKEPARQAALAAAAEGELP